jgi:hypothetical protein
MYEMGVKSMNWMDKLEKKWGRYAIPNLSRYFVSAIVIGYLLEVLVPNLITYLDFSVSDILHYGQIWRLLTWVLMPVTSLDFFGLLFLLCVLMWGSSLEMMLGTFRMNVFLFGGVILSDIGGILVYLLGVLTLGKGVPVYLSTYYILFSMLLAMAICMPEGEVRIYFVLPIKMKWMLVFELIYLAYQVFQIFQACLTAYKGVGGLLMGIALSAQILFALLNMFLFFWFSKNHITRKQRKRQKQFRAQFSEPRPGSGITQHKCAICGRTEITDPQMQFRYCSKCYGSLEYCEEHIFTHQHRTGPQ